VKALPGELATRKKPRCVAPAVTWRIPGWKDRKQSSQRWRVRRPTCVQKARRAAKT